MESREELKARLRDLIGSKNQKRNMVRNHVNKKHASSLRGVLMDVRKEYDIKQVLVQQLGGEMLDMRGPKLHT